MKCGLVKFIMKDILVKFIMKCGLIKFIMKDILVKLIMERGLLELMITITFSTGVYTAL